MWNIEGTDEFKAWYATLEDDPLETLNTVIELLEQRGPLLARPYADTLGYSNLSNLKELRADGPDFHLRVLFCFDPRRSAILLLGGDKSGEWDKWYRWAIPEAERLYKTYLDELRKEGHI